jgi:hypothetical protein
VTVRIQQIEENPFIPDAFAANQRGMQAGEELPPELQAELRALWLEGRDFMVALAKKFAEKGVHKQWANRLIELFSWHTVVCSSTEWENFFNLRTHKDAQPEMQTVARLMRMAMGQSKPEPLADGDWHLPYIQADEIARFGHDNGWETLVKLSVARCAAVSYERQSLVNYDADLARFEKLRASGHMSPFEHQARVLMAGEPYMEDEFSGNFRLPFQQYRKMLSGERVWTAPEGT